MRILEWLEGLLGIVSPRASTGERGERAAEQFLRARGYRIVARNWRSPRDRRDELDLVCRDGEVLVFVEVKTRAPDALVSGYFAVDRRKKRVVFRAAHAYLKGLESAHRPRTIRFDIVEVCFPAGTEPQVRHYENVPLFPKYYTP